MRIKKEQFVAGSYITIILRNKSDCFALAIELKEDDFFSIQA